MLKCTKRQASKGYLKTCLSLFCLYFYVLSECNISWVYPLLVRKGQFALLRKIEFRKNNLCFGKTQFSSKGQKQVSSGQLKITPKCCHIMEITETFLSRIWWFGILTEFFRGLHHRRAVCASPHCTRQTLFLRENRVYQANNYIRAVLLPDSCCTKKQVLKG